MRGTVHLAIGIIIIFFLNMKGRVSPCEGGLSLGTGG